MRQDSHTEIISSIKATDIVRKNFSAPHFLWDSHHSVLHLWHIHKPRVSQPPLGPTGTNPLSQYPKHREKIIRGSREGGFLFVFLLWDFKLNLSDNIQIICSAWKQRMIFFLFLMKAEVCTNVLRAESVSNIYYHKLALQYWKLAALQFSDLPSPVCRTNTDVDTLCSPRPVLVCASGCLDAISREEALLVCLHIDLCLSEK